MKTIASMGIIALIAVARVAADSNEDLWAKQLHDSTNAPHDGTASENMLGQFRRKVPVGSRAAVFSEVISIAEQAKEDGVIAEVLGFIRSECGWRNGFKVNESLKGQLAVLATSPSEWIRMNIADVFGAEGVDAPMNLVQTLLNDQSERVRKSMLLAVVNWDNAISLYDLYISNNGGIKERSVSVNYARMLLDAENKRAAGK